MNVHPAMIIVEYMLRWQGVVATVQVGVVQWQSASLMLPTPLHICLRTPLGKVSSWNEIVV